MGTYFKTESANSLTNHDVDEAIQRALESMAVTNKGPVEIVGTSMAMQSRTLFVTVIAKSSNEQTVSPLDHHWEGCR